MSTPEPSRKYIQWKEEDIALLLTDLEQPGQYGKWKENKSGYSKRIAEHTFSNTVNHETIKFKIRWLETRYQQFHEQLSAPNADKQAILEKMTKEFPYYDRCKNIFDLSQCKHSIIIHEETPSPSSEPRQITIENAPPTMKRAHPTDTLPTKKLKSIDTDDMTHDMRLKMMDMELEYKKMDHQERLQEMKLEQLRLEMELQSRMQESKLEQLKFEIELQKLKRDSRILT